MTAIHEIYFKYVKLIPNTKSNSSALIVFNKQLLGFSRFSEFLTTTLDNINVTIYMHKYNMTVRAKPKMWGNEHNSHRGLVDFIKPLDFF